MGTTLIHGSSLHPILVPERYPTKDFFVLDVIDVAPKSDMTSMAYPIFSLSTRADMRSLRFEHNGEWLEIEPSVHGLATIFDKDVLIYAVSKLAYMKDAGLPYGQWVRITTHDLLEFTNRRTGGIVYRRMGAVLARLKGTTIRTNIIKGSETGFGLIEWYHYSRRGPRNPEGETYIDIKLSDWLFRSIENRQVLQLNRRYFHLRRPIHRAIYLLARKHCGDQAMWRIGVELLQRKIGGHQEARKFKELVEELEACDALPDYQVRVNGNNVEFRPRGLIGSRGESEPVSIQASSAVVRKQVRSKPQVPVASSDILATVAMGTVGSELGGALSSFGETLRGSKSNPWSDEEREPESGITKREKGPSLLGSASSARGGGRRPARDGLASARSSAPIGDVVRRIVVPEDAMDRVAAIAPSWDKYQLERLYIKYFEAPGRGAAQDEGARFLKWVRTFTKNKRA